MKRPDIMSAAMFDALAKRVYGNRYKRTLARRLGIHESSVARYAADIQIVPESVVLALRYLLEHEEER